MADTKISDLAALTGSGIADADEFVLVDKSDTSMAASGTDKRMVASEMRIAVGPQSQLGLAVMFSTGAVMP